MEYCASDYTNLCAIATYYKSNKGKDNANYSCLYNNMLDAYRKHDIRLLEFDISEESENMKPGGSLQAWSLFLEKSEIVGLYRNESAKFENEKIKSYVCEEITEECLNKVFSNPEFEERFDIIVDSGIESFKEKCFFFKKALKMLNPQGFYFMENLKKEEINAIQLQISDWKEYFPNCEYFFEVMENPLNKRETPLVIVQKLSE